MQSVSNKFAKNIPGLAAFVAGAAGTAMLTMFLMVLYTGEGLGRNQAPVEPIYTDF
ncbi:MAG: hypothetical protein AAGD04_12190 [Pseudomonadota bacterium]